MKTEYPKERLTPAQMALAARDAIEKELGMKQESWSKLQSALAVLVLNKEIQNYILAHDPKAYLQALAALESSGFDFSGKTTNPAKIRYSLLHCLSHQEKLDLLELLNEEAGLAEDDGDDELAAQLDGMLQRVRESLGEVDSPQDDEIVE